MKKLKKMLKNPRILILLATLIICFFAINYQFSDQGLIINSVEFNSSAYQSGIRSPTQDIDLTKREKVLELNDKEITDLTEFHNIIDSTNLNSNIRLKTDKTTYVIIKDSEDIGLIIGKSPSSNIRKGLELQGGTRVLLKPVDEVSEQDIKDIISTMEQRLNVYGLTDLTIKSASDLEGNNYITVELAGVSKDEVKELIAQQGKFEARIGNETVFTGQDVTFVCRSGGGTCTNLVEPVCPNSGSGYVCRFEFEIHLNEKAAEKHQQITSKLMVVPDSSGQRILEKTIDFYLDDNQVDSLQIDASLKGIKASRITISGPGNGATVKEAIESAVNNKNKLQTFLITGSLPTKLEIVKLDSISPSLGEEFIKNALLIGLLSLIAVGIVIYIRYRSLKVSLPIMLILSSEIFTILGFTALFKSNLDLAAIAGIIAAVGTGVNDQIVITDEVLKGGTSELKQSIKKAFFVILVAYMTTVAAMLPLLRAGAGLLTGFAIVTIVGVTIGVVITRPAFAAIIRILLED